MDKIFDALSRLKNGWNGYDAPAPSEVAISMAQSFVDTSLKEKYELKRVVPSVVGGIGITQRNQNKRVYIEFFNDGEIYALFSDSISKSVSKKIKPGYQSFKTLMKEIREYLNA